MRSIELPERETVKLVFGSAHGLSEQDYLAFCRANPDLRCERTAEGEIVIVPPAGGEGAYRSGNAFAQLSNWTARTGLGKAFDSSAEFILPDGSALSPDASWVSDQSLARLTPAQRREFLRLSPEFIIEVMSPSDRLKPAKEKMEVWIANGVQLAWLIDGDHQTVYVYRPRRQPVTRRGVQELAGEGPVDGFVLQLRSIWKGLA
ncbi:MAG TPA: Uma2 family endonuclease [Bryobacteraceae bacterium]|nr:Uma2 family endonuclease [Bryobacteraceae bacterium]